METLEGYSRRLIYERERRLVRHRDMLFRFSGIALGHGAVGARTRGGAVISLNRHISVVGIKRLRFRGLGAVARDFAAAGDRVDGVCVLTGLDVLGKLEVRAVAGDVVTSTDGGRGGRDVGFETTGVAVQDVGWCGQGKGGGGGEEEGGFC